MKMLAKLKALSKKVKSELKVYNALLKDKRTPLLAKVLLAIAIGYLLLSFDIIPDFIPFIGQIDDVIIVPLLFYIAMKIIPNNIIEEYRKLNYGINQA